MPTTEYPRVLLTILGIGAEPAEYELEGRRYSARLAPVALYNLLMPEERHGVVIALCTAEAKQKTFPILEETLSGVTVTCESIPSDLNDQSLDRFLEAMTGAAEQYPGAIVTADITHGFRYLSFLMYAGALYLAALGSVKIGKIYYALLNPAPKVSPFFDLTPLLELPRWVHALQTLEETGSAKGIAKLLRAGSTEKASQDIAKIMLRVSDAHAAGLPIELGREIGKFAEHRKPFRRILRVGHKLPLSGKVADKLESMLAPYELKASGTKTQLTLDAEELGRQARLIDDLLARGNLSAALGLMNEWTVSWTLWSSGQTGDWLDFQKRRRKAAGMLGALAAMAGDAELKDQIHEKQHQLGSYWENLGALRNALHHHGMRPQILFDQESEKRADKVREYWTNTLRPLPHISLECGGTRYRRVLVSPIGERPGVLFSAVKRASVDGASDCCLIICSERTEPMIAEALSRAGFSGEHRALRLENSYGGLDERTKLLKQSKMALATADEVFVNITGGTTLMGVVAEELAQEARKLARPVRRFALIDRRSQEEQKQDPFVEGELLWLDQEESNADD